MVDYKRLFLLVCTTFFVVLAGYDNALATNKLTTLYTSTQLATVTAVENKKIAFVSERDGFTVIYLMNDDGSDQRPLEKNRNDTYVSAPQWSSDGRQIIFSLSYPVARGQTEVHIINVDGSNARITVTEKNTVPADPVMSPDGKYIAFVSNRVGAFKIYVMNIDGSNQHHLNDLDDLASTDPKDQSGPSWSPKGDMIAFQSKGKTSSEIKLTHLDGSAPQTLVSNAEDYAWSPDGQNIAYRTDDGTKLCIINIDNKMQDCMPDMTDIATPNWSPNGRYVAFTARHNDGYDVFVLDSTTKNIRRLTDNSIHQNYHVPTNYDAVWSPDGKRLSFVGSDDIVVVSSHTAVIYGIDVDGSNLKLLTTKGSRSFSPAWQP